MPCRSRFGLGWAWWGALGRAPNAAKIAGAMVSDIPKNLAWRKNIPYVVDFLNVLPGY